MNGRAGRAPRVALVHDWLVGQRGGEQVLLALARLFPDAPIYTLMHRPGSVHPELEARRIVCSFIARLPGAEQHFRRYLPLFPAAVEAWDLGRFDGILSTSHCVAKGVRTGPNQWHLAYIHTPMRYLYDQMDHYLPAGAWGTCLRPLARLASLPLARYDAWSARRPTQLVANSDYVARRIARVWGLPSAVVHPPVDVAYFAAAPRRARQGLLVVGALVPYKRVELALALAGHLQQPLTILGDGPELPRLMRLAGPQVRFVQGASRAQVRAAYASAEALLFCGSEDFGMVPVEAMAAGCPVLALEAGGQLETVQTGGQEPTGVFFKSPEPRAMAAALTQLKQLRAAGKFSPTALRAHARRFDAAAFERGMRALLPKNACLEARAC